MVKLPYPEGSITNYGYRRITVNGKRVLEHRYVMERHLGRKLKRKERIHHIDGDKLNNNISNLILCSSQAEHIHKYHPESWKLRKSTNVWTTKELSILFTQYPICNIHKLCKLLPDRTRGTIEWKAHTLKLRKSY